MSSGGTPEAVADVSTIGILHPCTLKKSVAGSADCGAFYGRSKGGLASGLAGSLDAGIRP